MKKFTYLLALLGVAVTPIWSAYVGCYGKYTHYEGTGPVRSEFTVETGACISRCLGATFIRGSECLCYSTVSELTRINDSYCSLRPGQYNQGGNLGGSVYSEISSPVSTIFSPPLMTGDASAVKAYKGEYLFSCDKFGGALSTEPFCDYFPNNNPVECVSLCKQLSAKYALLGTGLVAGSTFDPVCSCVNVLAAPATTGYKVKCPGDLDSDCGSKDGRTASVYCVDGVCKEGEVLEPQCEHGTCGTDSCYREGLCYTLKSISSIEAGDDPQVLAGISCNTMTNAGKLVSLETREEQDFLTSGFGTVVSGQLGNPDILTSGYSVNCEKGNFAWDASEPESIHLVNENIPGRFDIAPDDNLEQEICFIWLIMSGRQVALAESFVVYSVGKTLADSSWRGSFHPAENQNIVFICEYTTPSGTTSTTQSTSSESSTVSSTETTSSTPISSSITPSSSTGSTTTLSTATTTEGTTTTTQSTSSESSTVSSTESVTTSTTVSSTPSTTTLSSSISSSTFVPAETTSSTSTTTEEPTTCGGCIAVDEPQYGNYTYAASIGETATFNCPEGFDGTIVATCIDNCKFKPHLPNYTTCSSPWIGSAESQIEDNEPAAGILELVKNNTNDAKQYFPHEIDEILLIVERGVELNSNQLINSTDRLKAQENVTLTANLILNNLVKENVSWHQLSINEKSNSSTLLLRTTQSVGFELASVALSTNACTNYREKFEGEDGRTRVKFTVYALDRNNTESEVVYDPGRNSTASLTLSGLEDRRDCLQMVGLYIAGEQVSLMYPPVRPNSTRERSEFLRTNSDVIGFSLSPSTRSQSSTESEGISIRVTLENKAEAVYPSQTVIHHCNSGKVTTIPGTQECSSWEDSTMGWSSGSCVTNLEASNSTHTVCECSQLASFGNIMSIHEYQCWPGDLDIITIVCESLSVAALVLTLAVHGVYRLFRGEARGSSERGAVILQISFWLGTSHLLILLFMNKNNFLISDDACVAVGVVLHFALLAAFGWMLVEGFLLYRMVIIVFDYDPHVKLYNMLIGYGVPLVVVAVTAGIASASSEGISAGYGNAAQCWLNTHTGYIWAFNAPVLVIVLINFGVLCMALYIAYTSTKTKEEKSTFTRRWVKGSLALVTIMGITWVIGFLTFIPEIWPLYIFGILNGLQGVFIFIFQCLLNERVVNGVRRVVSGHSRSQTSRLSKWKAEKDSTKKEKSPNPNSLQRRQTVVSRIPSSCSSGQSSGAGSIGSNSRIPTVCKGDYDLNNRGDERSSVNSFSQSDVTFSSSIPSSGSTRSIKEAWSFKQTHHVFTN